MADNRKAKRVIQLKEKIAAQAREKEELTRHQQLERARLENQYVQNIANGNYFLARYNMMVDQVENDNIVETIDGARKTVEFMLMEMARTKISATTHFRNAFFAKTDLNKAGVTDKEIDETYVDYVEGPIKRTNYDEKHHKRHGAHFV